MVPLIPDNIPELTGHQILIESGTHDPIVPDIEGGRLADLLKQAGAEVTVEWQNTGHGLINSEIQSAQAWMKKLRF